MKEGGKSKSEILKEAKGMLGRDNLTQPRNIVVLDLYTEDMRLLLDRVITTVECN
jgi:hypothetical protein